ncbi:protein RER1A-like [Asparagus officinalis]|uniref:protein RER1A-like n=1 Tax=Asparagus officinalis TaxID=4686 RepID=UPI00098E0017|nr:protein RER1A-like [Asparagus officinalis]
MVVRSLEVDKDPFRPKDDNEEMLGPEVPYLSTIGALLYLANCTRPDIAFAMNLLASAGRWLGTLAAATIYVMRVYFVQGFYIISYGLSIYVLNLLIGFLSPMVDPEIEALDGASLPMKGSDEFKPFIRRLPEFKFWYSITKAFCVAFLMTFFSIFDVPVFWPILLFYWIVLFVLTMKRQILHMIKYKYVPFSIGKQRYGGKKASPSSSRD